MTAAERLYRVRCSLMLTQREFAARFGIPYGVVKDVEQGRFKPVKAMQVLIAAIDRSPDLVARAAATLR